MDSSLDNNIKNNIDEFLIPVKDRWENLDITNDYIFGRVMQDKELCAELIRRILPDIEIGRIEFPERQKMIAEGLDVRSVRFDIYTRSESGSVIDIEMQVTNERDLPKRTRAYHLNIGMSETKKDKTYEDLPPSFVIFICAKFDPFKKGRHIYTFQNLCREDTSIELNDGTYTIFITPRGKKDDVSKDLKNFLNFVAGKTSDDPFIKKLEQRVWEAKQNTDWRIEYMMLSMRDQEKISEGEKRGIVIGKKLGEKQGKKLGYSEALSAAAAYFKNKGMNAEEIAEFQAALSTGVQLS